MGCHAEILVCVTEDAGGVQEFVRGVYETGVFLAEIPGGVQEIAGVIDEIFVRVQEFSVRVDEIGEGVKEIVVRVKEIQDFINEIYDFMQERGLSDTSPPPVFNENRLVFNDLAENGQKTTVWPAAARVNRAVINQFAKAATADSRREPRLSRRSETKAEQRNGQRQRRLGDLLGGMVIPLDRLNFNKISTARATLYTIVELGLVTQRTNHRLFAKQSPSVNYPSSQ